MSNQKHDTRESWLAAAVRLLDTKFFDGNGYKLPEKLMVGVGFPSPKNAKAIGSCFGVESTEDGTIHMFISPILQDPYQVLATLLHEMIHSLLGIEEGHGPTFKKMAREFGLAGRITATYCEEGSQLWTDLAAMLTPLGDYPHSAIKTSPRIKVKKAANGGWVRLQSKRDARYKVLVSPKQLEEHGAPLDPWGDEMVEAA